jgi:uncharacterized protein (UPF0276 family)
MSEDRRAYFEYLKEQRRELESKVALRGPLISAGLAIVGLIIAAVSVSVAEPVLSLLGLAVAFAGAPTATRAFVERNVSTEKLKALDAELDRLERLNRAEIEGREPGGSPPDEPPQR